MNVNQFGQPIEECQLFVPHQDVLVTQQERDQAIALLCEHLKVEIWRTNQGYGAGTELVLKPID